MGKSKKKKRDMVYKIDLKKVDKIKKPKKLILNKTMIILINYFISK